MGEDPTGRPVPSRFAGRIRLTYLAVRANPVGNLAVKILVALVGAVVVLTGVLLIPLPGPGWLIVILGLTIWAVEFAWARHLLRYTHGKLRTWTGWAARQPWPVRMLVGLVGLVFAAVVVYLTLRVTFGVDIWHYVTAPQKRHLRVR